MVEWFDRRSNMDTSILSPEDYKYVIDKPDRNFSPKRNKAIIDQTIRQAEKFFKKTATVINESTMNKIDVVSTYGTYRFNRGTKSFRDYVGKKLYSELVGEKILQRVRVMDSVNKLSGNTKYKNHILL